MRPAALTSAAIVAGLLATGASLAQVAFKPELVKLPDDYEKGVMYGVVSNPNNKLYREFFTTKEAVDAVKAGKPIPSGTWIVMRSFKSKLDPAGQPIKGADGQFIKDELAGLAVMEKRTGWGADYPDSVRNGEWEYQAFTATKAVNDKANIKACFECHKPKADDDYLFTLGLLKAQK